LNDKEANIEFFKQEMKKFIEERKWTKYHTPKNLIQALGIEVAELSEIFLFRDVSLEKIFDDEKIYDRLSDEIADVFIYLISLINVLKIDLTTSFLEKMEKNRIKYSTKEFNKGNYHKK